LATAAGAVAVEKHFTYRATDQAWHDHALSAEPDDLRTIVAAVREAEIYMGRKERVLDLGIETRLTDMRRSVGVTADIPANTPLKREWLTWLRPAWGMHPNRIDEIVGKTLKRDVKAGDLLQDADLA
jgi:sialic acid synthase SpsE